MNVFEKIFAIFMTKKILGSLIVIVVAYIIIKIFNGLISRLLVTGKNQYEIKRRTTIVKLFQSFFRYVTIIISSLIILDFYGVNTKSLVASIGAVGVVIGLALQDTVKDLISGISLILENYLAVGDIVTYEDFTGEVIELGLRTTKIKKASGEVLIIANRNIDTLINSSQKKANLMLEIPTAYEEPADKVEKVLKELLNKAIKENLIFPDSEYLGIAELGNSSVKYLINVHCDQTNRYTIKREMLKRIKNTYEKNNIKIPYDQIEVHNGKNI